MDKFPLLTPDRVCQKCFEAFDKLPKTGKPIDGKEWTVLSAILQYNNIEDSLEVVSLGTGTKCLGRDSLTSAGDTLHDSHAEVMARRGFLRYLLQNMLIENDDLFELSSDHFQLKSNISFHFFSTHPPCGDASIFAKEDEQPPVPKKIKLDEDTDHITGAKLIAPTGDDKMAQDIGAIRTKPGKGVRTCSVSCSDKLSRWNVVGVQGSLISLILSQPIILQTYTISEESCNREAMDRALWKRWAHKAVNQTKFTLHQPLVQSSRISFKYRKRDLLQPSPNSIVWCNVDERPLEVAVVGKRQGMTKKKLKTSAGRLLICKIEMFQLFRNVIETSKRQLNMETVWLRYTSAKEAAKEYRDLWNYVKSEIFDLWTKKPDAICYEF